jgi:hypothetical protein
VSSSDEEVEPEYEGETYHPLPKIGIQIEKPKIKRSDMSREKRYKAIMEKNKSGALQRLSLSIKITLFGKFQSFKLDLI